MQDDVVNDVD
jgi:hypothetical protein